MGRGGESPNKRRITAQRNERRSSKNERVRNRRAAEPQVAVDEPALMERFHELNEQRLAGALDDAEYEAQRHEIFVALGLEDAFQSIRAEREQRGGTDVQPEDGVTVTNPPPGQPEREPS